MRSLPFSALLLAACSQQPVTPDLATGNYAGGGRNRLCIAGEGEARRAGLIVYGPGDANCSASGRIEQSGAGWALVPRGEGECRIPLILAGEQFRIGAVPVACSYYCGPGATLDGHTFGKTTAATPVTDLAGDPLC